MRTGHRCLLAIFICLGFFFTEVNAVFNLNGNNNPLKPVHKTVLSNFIRGGAREQKEENADAVKQKSARSSNKQQEREQLYEAYNLLHSLAQDFHKPFDAPAVIVVGHQTSGKSALIEALMGFQFNQVGGGTKTRRPVALRMQYNPSCTQPLCFLTLENGKEEQRSLGDIQAYIEAENKRLERDPSRCFDSREINIRMEYKYCPNMIVIDTPGMIHPPKGRQLTPQQRALVQASREAEALVLSKIRCQDYIILCVEDTTDWKHATTRNIVMQADPDLTRTVLVTTKLDTKIPQFSEGDDLEDFLRAPLIGRLFPHMLGGPFYTTVPSGRVGVSKDYSTNEIFVRALLDAERQDKVAITSKMGPTPARTSMEHVGVSRLRSFLEARVEDCYRRNVAKIVPLLQSELRLTEAKLVNIEKELEALSIERLKQSANVYRERFAKELESAIHGSVKANPDEWGESLDAEQLRGGSFLEQEQVQSESWQRLLEMEVGNCHHRLFGGAQYHRALREFTVAVRHMTTPTVSEDEIANAAGMGDIHDGVNFMRAACVIAVEKAKSSFDPMLEALRSRAVHIMHRLFPIVEYMVRRNSDATAPLIQPCQEMIRRIYERFVESQVEECLSKCRDDLKGMTRFITWDADGKSGSSALYRNLPTPGRMVEIYSMAVDTRSQKALQQQQEQEELQQQQQQQQQQGKDKKNDNKKGGKAGVQDRVLDEWSSATGSSTDLSKDANTITVSPGSGSGSYGAGGNSVISTKKQYEEDAQLSDYHDLLQLTEEMLSGRNANRTRTVITALVQYIIRSWRSHFARTVSMKFNCFFLMPFLDDFPAYLRNELDSMYESDMNEMFDITEARKNLQAKRTELLAECDANAKLQRRFDQINMQLRASAGSAAATPASGNIGDDDYPGDFGGGGSSGGGGGGGYGSSDYRGSSEANFSFDEAGGASSNNNYEDVELDFDETIFEPSSFSSYGPPSGSSAAAIGDVGSSRGGSPSSAREEYPYGDRPTMMPQSRDIPGGGGGGDVGGGSMDRDSGSGYSGKRGGERGSERGGGLFRNTLGMRRGNNKDKASLADV